MTDATVLEAHTKNTFQTGKTVHKSFREKIFMTMQKHHKCLGCTNGFHQNTSHYRLIQLRIYQRHKSLKVLLLMAFIFFWETKTKIQKKTNSNLTSCQTCHDSICGNRCLVNLCLKQRCLPHYLKIQISDKDTCKSKVNTLYLLSLSHVMVNSEIYGTSLACTLCSCPLFRYLWIKRLAKDWSFPWAILRQMSQCLRKNVHRQPFSA